MPLGITWPGETYAEPGTPNWVGYLATRTAGRVPLTYCYAVGGARVHNVKHQIQALLGEQDAVGAAGDSLCATWVGINDIVFGADPEENIQRLLEAHANLYDAGMRNFLFFNLPPLHKYPKYAGNVDGARECAWNTVLARQLAEWKRDGRADAMVFLYSAYDTFSRILDDPVSHGFTAEDARRQRGALFVDGLHPTSAVHKIVAQHVGELLDSATAETMSS